MHKNKDLLLAALLALVLSLALFSNGLQGDFVFDDAIVIVGNPFINGSLDGLGKVFLHPYFAYQPRPGLYRPLTIASYTLNASLFGFSPVSFHVINVLLHALTAWLVFVLLYRWSEGREKNNSTGANDGRLAAWIGFLFFMFLPLHVEAVTSIVGRAEILSLLFSLAALWQLEKRKYLWAAGLFFLGLLSKEMALAFLPVFLFVQGRGLGISRPALKKFFCYFVPPLIFYALMRYRALGEYFLSNDATPVYNPLKFAPFLTSLATSFKVFYLYLKKVFWPLPFSSDYSFDQISLVANFFTSAEALTGAIILGLLIFWFFKTKDWLERLGLFIFLASYFVISNWIFKTGTIMAERLMYTPSLGLAVLVGTAFKPRVFKVLPSLVWRTGLIAVLVFWGFLIVERNRDWRDEQSLYQSALAAAPRSVVNQTNGAYLDFKAGRWAEAEDRLNKVLALTPGHLSALNLAGQNYKKLGQYQKAEDSWRKAIALRPDYLRAYLSLGVLYYENGYFKSAEKVLTEAVAIYPRWSEILFLALTEVSLNKPQAAIELIKKHFGEQPVYRELKFALGWAYFNQDEKEKANHYFNQVKDPTLSLDDFIKTFTGSKVIILGEF